MLVEIWSDIVCPWCYIGKRRFEAALEEFDEEVEIVYRSFELDPGAPRSTDVPLDQALARKYGMSIERAREMIAHMSRTGREDGITFDFENARTGNTFDAHRLLHFASARGLQARLKERLLQAYFTEGRAIADHDVLVELAAEVGLDPDEAQQVLSSGEYGADVRRDQAQALEMGVRGVPFFLIDSKYGLSGAQPAEVLQRVLLTAREEAGEADESSGEACDVDGCAS